LSCLSVYPSVRPPAWNNSTPTERVIMKFYSWLFFENLSKKSSCVEISQE
jgi:hypothetical protein